jgi:hypothetical protein
LPGQIELHVATLSYNVGNAFFRADKLEKRAFLQSEVITKNSWGMITYTGPQLSIYDEDVLLAILAVIDSQKRPTTETKEGTAWTYKGKIRPVLQMLGYKTPSKTHYKRFHDAIDLLTATAFRITTKSKKWVLSNIIAAAHGEGNEYISITVNPFFYNMYVSKSVNLIDFETRIQISGEFAKAIHRFFTSHRDGWEGNLRTLCAAINAPVTSKLKEMRRQIKKDIATLVKLGVLDAESELRANDTVALVKPGPLRVS